MYPESSITCDNQQSKSGTGVVPLRRSACLQKKLNMDVYVTFITADNKEFDQENVEEALHSTENEEWEKAIEEEYDPLVTNASWKVIYLPGHMKTFDAKWALKRKTYSTRQIQRYKAKLVVREFQQEKGY